MPCSRTAEEPPTTSGTNPQTLTNSHSACPRKTPLLLFCPLTLALFQIPLAGNKQPTKHSQLQKGSAAIWTSSPYKNKLQEDRKRKETRDKRKSFSKIRMQERRQSGPSDANVSFIRGEHEMNRVLILRLRRW